MVGWLRVLPVEIPDEALTNRTVIDLNAAGLPEEILLALIQTSGEVNFSTSLSDLLTLRAAGLSDRVLGAIRARTSQKTPGIGKTAEHASRNGVGTTASAAANPTVLRCTGGPIKVGFNPETSVAVSLDNNGKLLLYAGMTQNPNLVLLIAMED
jgi:hypothetical protein